jgi:hypothetical protein
MLFDPLVLLGMLVVGIASLLIMKRVVDRVVIRWLTFVALIITFVGLLQMFLPQLAN